MAQSLPSSRVIRVCHTMVVRPRCSGVHSARAVSPCGMAAKKLVLLSIVVVRAGGQVRDRRDRADIVGQRHDGAAVDDVGPGCKFATDDELARHLLRRDMGDLYAQEIGEGRLLEFGTAAHDAFRSMR